MPHISSPSPQVPADGMLRRAGRWLRRIVWSAAAIAAIAVAAGFWWFVWSVPNDEVALDRNADGIVVLTGGASRVADAIELLSEGRGKRLLITGVHHATTAREIARLLPAYGRLMGCCVDLDHSALNTVGNAVETKRWAERRNIRSLIVVTSNYHMPRAMAELARRLPDVALIPFPVVTDNVRTERWWANPPIAKLLMWEYLKYIVAQVRMRLEPAFAIDAADTRRFAKG
jgi:uncharacterized SAM-binding protein YcdF (DUF218 family)